MLRLRGTVPPSVSRDIHERAGIIVAGQEGAAIVGGLSALGAGLYSIGVPKDNIVKYETALEAGKFILIVNGTPRNVAAAKSIVDKTETVAADHHCVDA